MPPRMNLAIAGRDADSLKAYLEARAGQTAEPFAQAYRTLQLCPPVTFECRLFWTRLARIVDGRGTCLDALFLSVQPTLGAHVGAVVVNLDMLKPIMPHCPSAAGVGMAVASQRRDAVIEKHKTARERRARQSRCSVFRPCVELDMRFLKKMMADVLFETTRAQLACCTCS